MTDSNQSNATPAAPNNILAAKAILATLTIRAWSARKFDKRVTREVNEDHGAKDAGRFNKQLVSKKALAEIVRLGNAARTAHYALTLPWSDEGTRILPIAHFEKYTAMIRELREQYESQMRSFLADYPNLVAEAEQSLNGLFDSTDYPSQGIIAGKFEFSAKFFPCPQTGDFRVSLSQEQAEGMQAEIARLEGELGAILEKQETACDRHILARMQEGLEHMIERLCAYQPGNGKDKKTTGKFHDTLVENMRELVELVPGLNVTGNSELQRVAETMQRELCAHEAKELRESDNLREGVASKAAAILADVQSMLG